LLIENGTGNEYAILSGQGDNEDPPSSELISAVNGNESPGVGGLEAGAPDQILSPDLQKSFMKQNDGPNAEGYLPSGTPWHQMAPGSTTVVGPTPGATVGYVWKVIGTGDCGGRDISCSKASEPSPLNATPSGRAK
jgi:hypothetical protein